MMTETVLGEPTIAILSNSPIRILHVDDDCAFLGMAKQCLELQADIQVESANSVKMALEMLKAEKFDVIVSDYQMAEKDGLEFLRELKAMGVATPFVLFTGKGRDEVAERALNLGAFRYMNKRGAPVAAYAELASCIRQAAEHARTQEKLLQSERRFRAVFDSSEDAILVLDDSGEIVYFNKAANAMLDFARSEITRALGEHFGKQFTKTYEQNMVEGFKQLPDETLAMRGKTVELTLRKASGEAIGVELSFSAFVEDGEWYGVSIVRDVTQRKMQELLLKESQQKLKALFSANPYAVVFTEKDFRVTDINHAFTELFGWTLENIRGKVITDVIVPVGFEEESEMVREMILEGPVNFITMRKKLDDSVFNVAMSGGPIWVDGKLVGFFMAYVDISDVVTVQSELEKALAKAELLNEKIMVLGGFTRHDARNKLGVIQGNLYLARHKCAISPELETYLQNIDDAIRNISDIFDFAKTYEMIGVEELGPLDVGKTVTNALTLFSDLKGVVVENRCGGLEVIADSLLTQVFYNLIDNSLKYGEKVTAISIFAEKLDDCSVRLCYRDDGVGICDKNIREHLFQKGFGKGTGFGLFLIRKICEIYGWSVRESGKAGQGVQFEFIIPPRGRRHQP